MTEIAVLAASRLSDGVCVAGITHQKQWVRPTRPKHDDTWRQLERSDCREARGQWVLAKGNVVRIDLVRPIPKEAHSEDWLIGPRKPELVRRLCDTDYRRVCRQIAEPSLEALDCDKAPRSLVMVRPSRISSFSFGMDERKGTYVPRCSFTLGRRHYSAKPVSDLEWRGYGRRLVRQHNGKEAWKAGDIFRRNGTEACWLTVGRNLVASQPYLLVVGVHLFPVRRFPMDFQRS